MSEDTAARELVVDRGRHTVLDGLDLDIPAGRVTGLLGPSGSGKTTLIRCLAGVQQLVAGRVTVAGHPAGSDTARAAVGYMPQRGGLYPDLSTRENIEFWRRIQGAPVAETDRLIDAVALADCADRVVAQLSGGQRARVSLACAMVGSPAVLLLDEPTVGLDPELRLGLWQRFRAIAADGATILVSTHVMDEAYRCDWLILMRDGDPIACGTPDDLLQRAEAATMEEAFLRLSGRGA